MKLLLILQYYNVKATYKSTCSQGYNSDLRKKVSFFLEAINLLKA